MEGVLATFHSQVIVALHFRTHFPMLPLHVATQWFHACRQAKGHGVAHEFNEVVERLPNFGSGQKPFQVRFL